MNGPIQLVHWVDYYIWYSEGRGLYLSAMIKLLRKLLIVVCIYSTRMSSLKHRSILTKYRVARLLTNVVHVRQLNAGLHVDNVTTLCYRTYP